MLDDLVELGPLDSSDGKSGAVLERFASGDERFIRKRFSPDTDWVMRVSNDHSFRPPLTLLHGDYKLGNLGTGPDGRSILLDWALPGQGPPCSDLAHYLCLNAARLPEPKEAVVEAYRAALEQLGVDTGGWFDRQLALCLLGYGCLMGWEKAHGGGAELAWWQDRALAAEQYLVRG